jgi:hypothetical protein
VRDGKVLPHISERVLLKSGGVERDRDRLIDGKLLRHISERVLMKSGDVERERETNRERHISIRSHICEGFTEVRRRRERERDRERETERYYLTYLRGIY